MYKPHPQILAHWYTEHQKKQLSLSGVSIHFSDWGVKSKKNVKFFGALCAQSCNIKLCAQSVPQNRKLCMFCSVFMLSLMVLQCFALLFKPILALHILLIFQVVEIIGGGGGKTICLPPNIFIGGATAPPGSTHLITFVEQHSLKSRHIKIIVFGYRYAISSPYEVHLKERKVCLNM